MIMQKNQYEQIEKMKCEISHIINDAMYHLLDEDDCNYLSEHLYEQGYRKQNVGEWRQGDMPTYGGYKCSVCGGNTIHYKANYCPNCGARMKGGAG